MEREKRRETGGGEKIDWEKERERIDFFSITSFLFVQKYRKGGEIDDEGGGGGSARARSPKCDEREREEVVKVARRMPEVVFLKKKRKRKKNTFHSPSFLSSSLSETEKTHVFSAPPLLGLRLGTRVACYDRSRGEGTGEWKRRKTTFFSQRWFFFYGDDSPPLSLGHLDLAKKNPHSQPYEGKLIEFSRQEHKTDPTIKKLNPRQQIPTFEDGEKGAVVNESLAAVLYLDSTYQSGTSLVPLGSDPKAAAARGAVYQRVFEAANLHSAMRDVVYPKMRGLLKTEEEEKEWKEVKVEALKTELARWESYLSDDENEWLVPAASFSAADIAVLVLILAIQRFGADLGAFSKLQKYAKKAAERPSVAATWPPHWKESEGPGFIKGLL